LEGPSSAWRRPPAAREGDLPPLPTKLDLFLAVLEHDAEREAARWEAGSVADVLTGLAAEPTSSAPP
jgi:hypothetical protein